MATVVQVGSTNAVHPSTGRKRSQEPALSFDLFPAELHPTLREIDDEGNGVLEIDELTEIFEKYADMKRAQKSGAIAVSSFSPDVQKTLKVFDSSGDGLIEPSELQRAAELYADSRLMVSRLIKLSVALLIFMGVMLGCIAGLTITIVEEAKETKTSGDGVQTVKGHANKPVATGTVMSSGSLFDTLAMDNQELNMVNELTLTNTLDDITYGYTITGFTFHNSKNVLFFHTARGDKIKVTPSSYSVMDVQDEVRFQVNKTAPTSRRKLLQADTCLDSCRTNSTAALCIRDCHPRLANTTCGKECFDQAGNFNATSQCLDSCESDSDSGSDSHSDSGSDSHSDSGSDSHSDSGSDSHSDSGSDSHSDSGSDSDPDGPRPRQENGGDGFLKSAASIIT